MNKYYDNNDQYISNKRIFEAYFTEIKREPSAFQKALRGALCLLASLAALIVAGKERGTFKAVSLALCLLGMIGLIGAMESGSISMLGGIGIALILLAIEYFCLAARPNKKQD